MRACGYQKWYVLGTRFDPARVDLMALPANSIALGISRNTEIYHRCGGDPPGTNSQGKNNRIRPGIGV